MKPFIALLFALIVASAHTGEAATRFLFAYGVIGGNAMPLWIAQEQGIFRKYDLEPQLIYIIAGRHDHIARHGAKVVATAFIDPTRPANRPLLEASIYEDTVSQWEELACGYD